MDKQNDIGIILKTEREQRGLTLEVIQEATKIPIDSLKAIEEGYKIRTLTAFYYKSFVRLYAQHLGLDPLPILALIPSYQPVSKMAVAEKLNSFPRPDLKKFNIIAGPVKSLNLQKALPFVLVALAVILAGGVLFLAIKGVAERIALSAHQSVQGKTLPVSKNDKSVKVLKPGKDDRLARVEKPVKADKVEKPVKAVVAEGPGGTEARGNETAPAAGTENREIRKVFLTVKAAATTWLTVRSDGKVVFKGSLKKGSNESWSALKKIDLSGKDVNLLEYEVNGKNIGKLSRRDSNARRVIVTPEGLSVEK
ncbi:MAG: DUF4115 domain-containing protein [Candidatus Omnitrophica bacterium]|nr:DUF4115 domain-containing protein [Candidatus Omnitrophota bacterium]